MRQIITHHSSSVTAGSNACPVWPDPWRMALIALCALILCSCRSPGGGCNSMAPVGQVGNLSHEQVGELSQVQAGNVPQGRAGRETLPAEAYTGAAGMAGCPAGCCPAGCPWSPPGIRQPWPEDEYLCDGGDRRQAGRDQRQEGNLGPEDGRHRGPLRHARRPNRRRTEQRGVPLQPAIRRRASGGQPEGRRGAAEDWPAFTIRKSSTPRPPFRFPPARSRTFRRATRSPPGRPWPCAPSRATA